MADTNLLYQKIANDLRESIYSGTLKEGERLPTEMDLAKQSSSCLPLSTILPS